jgi:hypothetical protein
MASVTIPITREPLEQKFLSLRDRSGEGLRCCQRVVEDTRAFGEQYQRLP